MNRIGDRDLRLERQMQALLGAEGVLEDAIGRRERRVDVAAAQMKVERHVGVLAARQMLEVGESSGGLELLVNDDGRLQGLDLVIDGRQFVVFRFDELHGLLGDVRIGREHHRHRLADEPHLVDRDDRLIVEGRAVIGRRNDRPDILAGHDAHHTRERRRRPGVDRADAAVRDGRAEHLAEEHAGQAQVVGIFGAARHLGARLQARDGTADLRGHE